MTFTPQRPSLLVCAAAVLLVAGCAHRGAGPANPADVLKQADVAMGASQLKTLRYAATGTGAVFGQAYQPGGAWPQVNYSSYSRLLDYDNAAMREDFARSRAEPTGGGAIPLMGMGEQRAVAMLRGNQAWNLTGPAPQPAPVALDGRIHDLWTTPHGVIKAALRNRASVRSEGGKSIATFTEPGRFTATAVIGNDGLVERVESVQPHPVVGDTATVTLYSDYRDAGGIKFPGRIRQMQGSATLLDLHVSEVQANPAAAIEVPALVQGFAERVVVEEAAAGVWYLAGGSHHSILIEMKDHLILVESPLYDGRALAVLAEVRKLVSDKPVRYVVNSHHHFDHAGGLRAALAGGATLIASEQARPFYEQALANPNRISPDALAKSGRSPVVQGISGMRAFSDGSRSVEVHQIEGSVHAQGFLMVWLPRERLLIQADAYTPGAPNSPTPAQPNANHVKLVENIARLKLDVAKILPLHGRIVPATELYTAAGRSP